MLARMLYTTEEYGSMRGMPAIYIEGGENDYTYPILCSRIEDAVERWNMKFPYVVLDLREIYFMSEHDVGEATKFVDWLLLSQISVAYNVNGNDRPSFLRMGGFIRVFIEDDDWLHYPVNELFWTPNDDPATEPDLKGYDRVPKFLNVSKEFPLKDALSFVTGRAEKVWILNIPVKQNIRMEI